MRRLFPTDSIALAQRIVDSPLRQRALHSPHPLIAQALELNEDTAALLQVARLRQLAAALSQACGTSIDLRSCQVFVAGRRFPDPQDFPRLLSQARRELASHADVVRVGLAGLFALLVHPFSDGNGRLCRLLWVHGLLRQRLSATQAIAVVTTVYLPDGDPALYAFEAASGGDIDPFVKLWTDACDSVKVCYAPESHP